jgi:undecaprenyl-diphosphatase
VTIIDAGPAVRSPVRHPGDLARVLAGGTFLAASAAVARQGRLSDLESDVFRVVNHLPGVLAGPLQAVMQAGSLAAVPVAGLVALAASTPRLARNLTLSGTGAWAAAKALKAMVGRGRPGALIEGVVFHGGLDSGLGFPSGHAAVAAALATAGGAYLAGSLGWADSGVTSTVIHSAKGSD